MNVFQLVKVFRVADLVLLASLSQYPRVPPDKLKPHLRDFVTFAQRLNYGEQRFFRALGKAGERFAS